MRRTKGERTEDALLQAARRVFARKGYFNARITDITAEAGRSVGSFYNYYENKSQLLDALLDQFATEVTEASLIHRTDDPHRRIRGAVAAYWNTFREHLPEMVGLIALSMTDERYAERWRVVRALGIKGVIEQLEAARDDGYLADLDIPKTASAIISMLESFSWTWLARDGDLGVGDMDDESAIATMTEVWYRLVYGPPGAAAADSVSDLTTPTPHSHRGSTATAD